ncbi:hypothetical protein KKA72_00020 [Patescibacteria group bacterium]|nr:hypothetical protein [Patescibacteria group bacterium]MBU1876731.1 hypothetical protein [Patescibacteria group bacterium]
MNKKRLIVIDSNSVIHRAFHALPPLIDKKGEQTGAIYGFLLALFKAIKDFHPDFIATCFDVHAPTFRHKKFKGYKAKRLPAPQELYNQIPKIKNVLEAFKIPIFEKEGFEADDIIGTIAKSASEEKSASELEIVVLSGDRDPLQLINNQIKVLVLNKGIKNSICYDEDGVKEKYGISPIQMIDFKALRGDPSDNIPGVSGIGEKTAVKLLKEFNDLDNLYKELEDSNKEKNITPKWQEILLKQKKQAYLSRFLGLIRQDVPIDFNLAQCQWQGYGQEAIKILQEFGFKTLVKRLSETDEDNQKEKADPLKKNLKLW